ncbi:MAG: quinone-dependent dihydroorotate dehydrogenase [Bacteroidia bacterium]
MYRLIKSILFLWSPEKAHYITMGLLSFVHKFPGGKWILEKLFCYNSEKTKISIAGITLKNGVGLAAGFDKNARYIDVLASLGFGFIEIGTLTPKPQDGNEKPRLFRLPKDEALINRMGFNNNGVDAAVELLKKVKSDITIGGNIGKNKLTPNEEAYTDYAYCFEKLYKHVHYFVVNVSSPNTPGLRELQEKPALKKILTGLQTLRIDYINQGQISKPIFLKIAPDLTHSQLDDIIDLALEINLDGLVATNTTIDRSNLKTTKAELREIGNGGLSGKPLKKSADEVLKYLAERLQYKVPIIGVGGIHSGQDALDKLKLGAKAVQLYTGFIFEGPFVVKRIVKKVNDDIF